MVVDLHFGACPALTDDRLQGQYLWCIEQTDFALETLHIRRGQLLTAAPQQRARQRDAAVTYALETTDLHALRFPQAADFTITTFLDHHLKPLMAVAGADRLECVELGGAIFQLHAAAQALDDVFADFALDAAHILALDFARRMHQRMCQLAIGGEQQQTGGIDVQSPYRNPAGALEHRQVVEYGRSALGVFTRGDFALGLVVQQYPAWLGQYGGHEHLAVEFDTVATVYRLTNAGDLTIDLYLAAADTLFQCPARAKPGLRQHLVQALFEVGGVRVVIALE